MRFLKDLSFYNYIHNIAFLIEVWPSLKQATKINEMSSLRLKINPETNIPVDNNYLDQKSICIIWINFWNKFKNLFLYSKQSPKR